MEQAQVQQLQLQGAVDALKGVIDNLLQDKMNLSAQVNILGTQLRDALQQVESFQKANEAEKESNEYK